ncbi:unnamed protein product [Hermetia illucens]|uniref:Uncharacterized protein n=1 Tax=Hermetia illucens TaxID=343691 RepID=A0A7R8YV52_HERIL|nr:uncharacterized protein LOC119651579 [Hermetia illucens]CAD7086492.1 unnamed protein product [Hermetia illucens]
MELRVLNFFILLVGPSALSALQIFKEGSTETPQLFKTAGTKQPDFTDYSYQGADKKKQNDFKELQALQKEKKLLELYQQQSRQKSFKTEDLTSGSGLDESENPVEKYQKLLKSYQQQSDEKCLQIEDLTSGAEISEDKDHPNKDQKQKLLEKLISSDDPAKLLKFYQQQSEKKPLEVEDPAQEPAYDETEDLAKKYQKQKLLKELSSLDDPAKLLKLYQQQSEEKPSQIGSPTGESGFDESEDPVQKHQKQKLLQKLASLDDPENKDISDLKAFINKKFTSKASASDESQFYRLQHIKNLHASIPETLSSGDGSDNSDKLDKAFLLKWAKESSKFPKGPSGKMPGQEGDPFKYFQVISTYKVAEANHQGNPLFSDFTKELSPFLGTENNPLSYGFQKSSYAPIIKVVKIVQNEGAQSFLGPSGSGIDSIPQFNPFYQQGGSSPQIVSKVKVFKPIHYTNTLGLKPASHSSTGYIKPVEVTVKKIVKPLISY